MFSWLIILVLSILGIFDLFVLIALSRGIGIPVIIFTQIIGAIWGIWKIRRMDFSLLFLIDTILQKNEPIVREVWEEAIVLTGACLLVVPGFLSDSIGIAFLIPYLRNFCLELISEIKY